MTPTVQDTLHDLLNAAEVLEEQRKSSLGVAAEWDQALRRRSAAYFRRKDGLNVR